MKSRQIDHLYVNINDIEGWGKWGELKSVSHCCKYATKLREKYEGLERITMSFIQARRARQAATICKPSSDLVLY